MRCGYRNFRREMWVSRRPFAPMPTRSIVASRYCLRLLISPGTATLGLRVAWPSFPPPFDLRLHLDVWHLLLMRFKSPIWSSFYFRHFNRAAGRGSSAREKLHAGYISALHKLRYIDTVCNVGLSMISSIAGVILRNNWANYLMSMTLASFFFGTALGATKGIDMSAGTIIIVLNEASLLAFVALQLWRTISLFRLTCFGILTATISALWAGFCIVRDVWPTKDTFAFGAVATVLVSAACSLSSSIFITALAAVLGYSLRAPRL